MSDDLDQLKAALRDATPDPDAAQKAAHIALARENFAALQETRDAARQTSDRSKKGVFRGVMTMIMGINRRGAMTATTALVAIGLVAVVPDWRGEPLRFGTYEESIETRTRASNEPLTEAEALIAAPSPEIAEDMSERLEQGDRALSRAPAPANQLQALGASPMVLESDDFAGVAQPLPLPSDQIASPEANTEAFPDADPNPLKVTAEEPVSTFSIDVDTASYAVVRSSLLQGQLPPADAVRIEEMVNYFPYDYAAPQVGDAPFQPTISVTETPWNPDTQLVHIAIQGEQPAIDDRPPLNLVFLIDTSGSMNAPNKLPLLKQSLALMLPQLTEADSMAIVTYAGSAGQVLAPTPATDRDTILEALNRLDAGGSTAGQAGLQQAYAVAEGMSAEGEVTRVVLATDGDFNVGLSDPDALKDFIADKRDTGAYLSVFGFGRGNLDDATMQALAQNGNGQAAYIDTLSEAQKVMVDQLSGALFPIANDVKIQVEFNPATVAEYRLIGYETRALRREDFNNDAVDAGDIGAGHQVTALYEITPVGSDGRLTEPLRYGEATATADSDELGYFKLRYKTPGDSESQLIEQPILDGDANNSEMRFAAAIAGFGQLLRDEPYLGAWGFDDAIALANAARGEDPFGYRSEAVQLMRLAQSLQQ